MAAAKKIKTGRIFDTIADVGSLCMATLYILYVTLLLIFHLGTTWLNYCMLAITFIYIIFFITKIASLNTILEKSSVQHRARFILRYSKWAMKLINALFVVLSVATISYNENNSNVIMMLGVFLVGFSFLISVMWNISWFIARRKLRELKDGWDNLSRTEKDKRIESVISSFLRSLDSITGVDVGGVITGQRTLHMITASESRKSKTQTQPDTKPEQGQEE